MKIVKSSFILSVLGLSMVGCFGQETKTSQNTQRDQSQNVFPFICNEPVQNSENPFLSALTHPATLTLGAVATLWGASKLAYEVSDTVKGKVHGTEKLNKVLLGLLKPLDSYRAYKTGPEAYAAFKQGPEAYAAFKQGPQQYTLWKLIGPQAVRAYTAHNDGEFKKALYEALFPDQAQALADFDANINEVIDSNLSDFEKRIYTQFKSLTAVLAYRNGMFDLYADNLHAETGKTSDEIKAWLQNNEI